MSNDDRQVIFSLIGVGKVHPPKRQVLKDIYLSFFYGAKIGVLGLNGAGKSTLLRIIAGVEQEYLGEITFSKGYSVGLLEQEPRMDADKTVKEVVEEGCSRMLELMAEYETVSARFGEDLGADEMDALLEQQAKLQDEIEAGNGWELESQLEVAMDALRCPPPEAKVDVLSGGERRRVALCRLLIQEPDILLLDEPTNHLDAESVQWLEQHLARYKGTVIAVTHDRYFLDNVAGWILELDRGHGIPFEGNYSSWLEQKQARLAQAERSLSRHRKTLERELEWIRMSPRARQAKGRARLTRYEQLLGQEQESAQEDLEIYIPPGPRLGDMVLQAEGLTHGFGDRLLFEDLSLIMPPGAIVGVIGPNGSGKTTLLRIVTGGVECQSGSFRMGETVRVGYVDQSRTLNDEHTVWEAISDGQDQILLGKREVNSRAYVGRFNFSGQDQQKKVRDLSGGERNRVHLARMLKEEANLLLLDEPTNDLDVNTMRALEDGLVEFAGSCVVVSHDRWFLDRIATHILAFEGDSQVVWFEGNYSDYEEDRRRRLGKEADQPHRVRYRRLTRD
ncbi:MAG: energy-dependent translational throttle protein EttA [Deltaproteobacteria bacterium]|nr:energy-dependent translational throttle protein EttA [Deltaproteobacteria bacterium]